MKYPKKILNWIGGKESRSGSGDFFAKINPATGQKLADVCASDRDDIEAVILSAEKAYLDWSTVPVSGRAEIIKKATDLMDRRKQEIAEIVALESGKPIKVAVSEIDAAVKCGRFLSAQLQEFEPQPIQSAVPGRKIELVRKSIGTGLLITPFNNPMAGIAWKAFPALLSGNSAIVKAHEDVPYVPVWFGKVLKDAGLPDGVYSVIQGTSSGVGAPLVADNRIKFISLTGSPFTGAKILKASADRLAKVCVEAGGKNPLVVCGDADLEKAATAAVSGSFVDAGQRCAATSRIIVFGKVYDKFRKIFLDKVSRLSVGISDEDAFGAIINEKRMKDILFEINGAVSRGAVVLSGGFRLEDDSHKKGFFIAPTVLENVSPEDAFSKKEIFGPAVVLYKVKDLEEAIRLADKSDFRLSSAIHTKDMARAKEFIDKHQAGVIRVNGPTHGSEPHVPFGGTGLSGNGWREPGIKALDFYSDWRQISID